MSLTSAAHVLVVEDDAKLARLLLDYLQADGHQAHAVADGLAAVAEIRRARPALVLLDLMLPRLDGIGVCRAVRAFSDVPIIMLMARVDEVDRLLGLETGADDYVCKPFSPRQVMARVKAQLRRAQGRLNNSSPLWQLDDDMLRIRWRGQWLPLTVLEFRMFRLMLQQPGRVYSRAQLLGSLHADDRDVSDRAIDSHVKNLRRKIESVDPGFEGISSVYGVGYRFDAPDAPGTGSGPARNQALAQGSTIHRWQAARSAGVGRTAAENRGFSHTPVINTGKPPRQPPRIRHRTP